MLNLIINVVIDVILYYGIQYRLTSICMYVMYISPYDEVEKISTNDV